MQRQLPPFNPATLAAAGTATLTTDIFDGLVLDQLRFTLGGTAFTKAMITSIQVKAGGKLVFDNFSGTQLDNMNKSEGVNNGSGETANYLTIFFESPRMSDFYGKRVGGLDFSRIKGPNGTKAVLEIIVKYTGATSPTLAGYGVFSEPKSDQGPFNQGEGNLLKAYLQSAVVIGAAVKRQQQTNINLGKAGSVLVNQYWHHDGNLTSLAINKDGQIVLDDVSQADQDSFNQVYDRVAISNLYLFSPTAAHAIGRTLSTLKGPKTQHGAVNTNPAAPATIEHLASTSAASTITVCSEIITDFNTLT